MKIKSNNNEEVEIMELYKKKHFDRLEKKYDLHFEDKELLVRAFIHPSFSGDIINNYERLEFLGDAVLQILSSDYIYRNKEIASEGTLSKTRVKLVNEKALLLVMNEEEIVDYAIVGKSIKEYDKHTASFIADMYEALLGAIYLDKGLSVAQEFFNKTIISRYAKLQALTTNKDNKTMLQEILQQNGAVKIKYVTKKVDVNSFDSMVSVNGIEIGRGSGPNKKEAEQHAAKHALERYV